MFRNFMMTAVIIASLGAIASAEVVTMEPGQFAVFAGQKLGTGSGITVRGNMGSFTSDIDLGQGATIYGNLFADDDIRVAFDSTVYGNAISGDYTTLGTGVTIGRIDAGAKSSSYDNEITVGNNSVVGGMYSSTGISVGSGVQISGNITSADDVTVGNDVAFSGTIRSGEDIYFGERAVVSGAILAAKKVTFKKNSTLSGNVHAGDDVKFYEDSVVSGRIYSGDKVTLGKRSTAGALHGKNVTIDDDAASGSIFASRDAKVEDRAVVNGSVNAGDDVELKKNARVNGDVTYKDDIDKDRSATVTGTTAKGTAVAPTAPLAPNVASDGPKDWQGSRRAVPTFISGSRNISVARDGSSTLTAGNYRYLSLGSNATLTLTAGTYNFADVALSDGARITADTSGGNVVINSREDFDMGSNGMITRLGNGDIIISSADDLNVGRNAQIAAQLRAYDDLSVGDSSTVVGTLYAHEELTLADGARVLANGQAPVPEPGTLVLLSLGGVMIAFRRRRRVRQKA
ncbi:MAG: polymer-forming cytoskeletal protein [Phycisphaerae bacterium]|jgi:predicted acyltransferase (DUF342 family)|nr:polymer-forming cytoskeletal protein [Phycisphaerae bacterium]